MKALLDEFVEHVAWFFIFLLLTRPVRRLAATPRFCRAPGFLDRVLWMAGFEVVYCKSGLWGRPRGGFTDADV